MQFGLIICTMKMFGLLLLLTIVTVCDPYGFGFKKNPAFVLDEAFKAISNLDTESFLEVTGKEALCVYGNESGLRFLKEKIVLSPENIKLNPNVLETKYFKSPIFAGFW